MSSIHHYGNHPTQYANQPDDLFYQNFRSTHWRSLDSAAREELLQEAVNRSAQLNGEIGSCKVSFSDALDGATEAVQYGDRIDVSLSHYGAACDQNADSGWKALETVLHEDRHAWQNQVVAGVIDNASPEQKRLFEANQGSPVVIGVKDGRLEIGNTYLCNARDAMEYDLYLAQPTEADAYRVSEARTDAICARQTALIEQELRVHPTQALSDDLYGAVTYRTDLQSRCFNANMAQASSDWGVDDLEKEVNTALTNLYEHENEPVNPLVKQGVRQAAVHEFQLSSAKDASQTQAQTPHQEQAQEQEQEQDESCSCSY